jgi:hypothetical protein
MVERYIEMSPLEWLPTVGAFLGVTFRSTALLSGHHFMLPRDSDIPTERLKKI